MTRFTKEIEVISQVNKDGTDNCHKAIAIERKGLAEVKLFELENIEEELGVDLKLLGILAKALKQGYIYYPIDVPDDCYKYKVDCMYYNYGEYYLYVSDGVGEIFAKDYGKTWALTKEELL